MAENQAQPRGEVLMEWQFPEFIQHPRGRGWYLSFAGVVVASVLFAAFTANYTFLMIIVIAAIIYLARMRLQPPLVAFQIREEGVEVGGRFYGWDQLKEFWMLYKPPEVKTLYLEFKGALRPTLDISLANQNPLKVRQALHDFLPENTNREEEPVSDQWSRMLKL